MKIRNCIFAATYILWGAVAHATIVVDGTGAGSNFATLQEGIDAALASSTETEIEIRTNSLPAGAGIFEGTTLTRPLAIRAGAGFSPVIAGTLTVMPDNEDTTVTLTGLTVAPTTDNTDGLVAAGNISATNCDFFGGGAVSAGIITATTSFGTRGRMELTSCSAVGFYAVVIGRSIEDYVMVDCDIRQSDIGNRGIVHFGNQAINRSAGIELTDPISIDGIHTTATTPRSLYLDRCRIRSVKPLSWPVDVFTGPPGFGLYRHFDNTIGPVYAKNTVFDGLGGFVNMGWSDLPGQNLVQSFVHCTFRNATMILHLGSQTGSTPTHLDTNITNCIFDCPGAAISAIPIYRYLHPDYNRGTITFTGNTNAYNVPPFIQVGGYVGDTMIMEVDAAPGVLVPNFETTFYRRNAQAADNLISDDQYHLLPDGVTLAANKAVALVPPVLLDFEKQIRPQVGLNDIGADEAGAVSFVNDWSVY